ncbi:MAG: hypothetical protein ABIZ81_06425 [Opitutaceae bacterium]
MPASASPDEPLENLGALQKQLILAQVQILELEDIRDELQARGTEYSKLLCELQSIADRSLAELQNAHAAETTARQALADAEKDNREVQIKLGALRRDFETASDRLSKALKLVDQVEGNAAGQKARIERLDAEMKNLKSSASWRWTAPLRSIRRVFGRTEPSP